MTLDRNINHSLSETRPFMEKGMELYNHIRSHELCGLDEVGKLIVYLFFIYLTAEDKTKEENEVSIDTTKGLSYKDLTELAYRAKWIEKTIGMEEYEIFSFISSIRDKLSFNLQEELKRGFEGTTDSFFSSCGSRIEVDEISDLLAFVHFKA